MPPKHARARKTHHLTRLLPPLRAVTVDRALDAGGFGGTEVATGQALHGVFAQRRAIRTPRFVPAVVRVAIEDNHRIHRALLARETPTIEQRSKPSQAADFDDGNCGTHQNTRILAATGRLGLMWVKR